MTSPVTELTVLPWELGLIHNAAMETSAQAKSSVCTGWELPPLILYPFKCQPCPVSFTEIDPCAEEGRRELESRYSEMCMLCYLGRDLDRWLRQCVEMASGRPHADGLGESSFVNLLLFDPPAAVIRKMHDWNVPNFQLVFSRAIGLNSVYPVPPAAARVSEPLLRSFHLYADALFEARVRLAPGAEIRHEDFDLEIYSSGEYTRLLEREWLADTLE